MKSLIIFKNDIFTSYKNRKPNLEYKEERYGKITCSRELKEYLSIKDEEIYIHNKENQPYYDYQANEKFNLNEIIKNYNINQYNLLGRSNIILKPQNTPETNAPEEDNKLP